MPIPSISQINVAVPAAGTPSRALTNKVLQDLSGSVVPSLASSKLAAMAGKAAVATSGRNAPSPVLDTLTGATALGAYGLTKLIAAYAGPAIKVNRVSDSAKLDIPFLADGIINTGLMIAFANATASSLTLETWYDQTGGLKHLPQATVGNQPWIDLMTLRNGMPMITGDASHFLTIPAGVAITSTANCAVAAVVGNINHNRSQNVFNIGTVDQFALELTAQSAYSVQPIVNGVKLNFGNPNLQTYPNANGCAVLLNSAAGGLTFYRNNYSATTAAVAAIAPSGGQIPSQVTGVAFDFQAFIVFNAALSAANAGLLQYGLTIAYSAVIEPRACVVMIGDSIQIGVSDSYQTNYQKTLYKYIPPEIEMHFYGIGGRFLQADSVDASTILTPLLRPNMVNIAIETSGVNDIGSGTSSAVVQGYATNWANAVKTAGFKAGMATLFARAVIGGYTAPMEAERVLFNTWLRANSGAGLTFDFIVDFDTEPSFVPTISSADFPDNLHPNAQAYRKAAPVIAAAIASQLFGVF